MVGCNANLGVGCSAGLGVISRGRGCSWIASLTLPTIATAVDDVVGEILDVVQPVINHVAEGNALLNLNLLERMFRECLLSDIDGVCLLSGSGPNDFGADPLEWSVVGTGLFTRSKLIIGVGVAIRATCVEATLNADCLVCCSTAGDTT